jgi:hypothetical protein
VDSVTLTASFTLLTYPHAWLGPPYNKTPIHCSLQTERGNTLYRIEWDSTNDKVEQEAKLKIKEFKPW